MHGMSLSRIAAECGGDYIGAKALASTEVSGIVIDSRLVEPGFLFVALKGERVDGHDFIPQVFDKGASCVLCERPPECAAADRPYILVDSCLEAIRKLAEYYRSTLTIPVIGISGSVGKTSTKEMVSSVLSERFDVLKTEGNFNNEIGLPLTIFKIRSHHEAAVLEMGVNHFGEMTRLSRMAKPDICILTNIGTCHLENLIDRDGVLRAKTEMFSEARPDARIILNGDDDKLILMRERLSGRKPEPEFFGIREGDVRQCQSAPFPGAADADNAGSNDFIPNIYAADIQPHGLAGTSCTFVAGDLSFPVDIPVPGRHMVYNALAAAAAGLALGLTAPEIQRGIASYTPIGGRNHIMHVGDMDIIDDCYNANPTSTAASLNVLSEASGRKVAVLGDMGELGPDAKRLHYETGRTAAASGTDVLLTVGPLSEETEKGFLDAAGRSSVCCHFSSVEELSKALPDILRPGDAVLIKASHFMGFENILSFIRRHYQHL